MTFGFSRDDIGGFLPDYLGKDGMDGCHPSRIAMNAKGGTHQECYEC